MGWCPKYPGGGGGFKDGLEKAHELFGNKYTKLCIIIK